VEQLIIAIIQAIYRGCYDVYYSLFVKQRLISVLNRYSSYYRKLGSGRNSYERKVWDFVRENIFIPREGVSVTFKLRIIIAAHAVQLSFRLPEEAYDYYEKILLYKDYYLSRITHKHHKAEVNPGLRIIVFSVRAIHESIADNHDGINVLLHEFAHALWLEHKLMLDEYEVFKPRIFNEVMDKMQVEFVRLQENENHFFRKYAFSNEAEFFAVAVENFFERPGEFQNELPDLYALLTSLMRQNPLKLN
jgi:MtfA peptidase